MVFTNRRGKQRSLMLAIFDFLVYAAAVFTLLSVRSRNRLDYLSQGGYVAIAVAAAIGTFRYAGFPALSPMHDYASTAAAILGVPCVAVSFLIRNSDTKIRPVLALLIGSLGFYFWSSAAYALLIGAAAQILWLAGGWIYRHEDTLLLPRVVLAVALTSIAGLLFNSPGSLYGLRNENIFHGLFALSLTQQGYAFSSR